MIAIIPARGGSKGLPGKNIRNLNGKPLIAYTIESALKSKYIDKVIVSTDDEEIAKVAVKYGAEVPFLRPKDLATDTALAIDVYIDTIIRLKSQLKISIEKFMVLLPTAPLRNEMHIDEAYELYKNSKADSVISITESPMPPSWILKMDSNKQIINANFGEIDIMNNRQANNSYYIPNGAIYILDYNLLCKNKSYYCTNTIGYLMDDKSSIDIDTVYDFICAETIIKNS